MSCSLVLIQCTTGLWFGDVTAFLGPRNLGLGWQGWCPRTGVPGHSAAIPYSDARTKVSNPQGPCSGWACRSSLPCLAQAASLPALPVFSPFSSVVLQEYPVSSLR